MMKNVWGRMQISVLAAGLCLLAGLATAKEATLDNFPSLVSDHRAYAVGQSVTVLIYEEASSTTSAGTSMSKSLDVSGRLEGTGSLDVGGVSIENGSTGQGSINRKGQLVASVSAT
ncbi:MAG: flagellar basal body L-ring protein FlgH, partial [Fuerstiella sp.]|nr:flagellar basal body L-ring protein FlgH [Fuerstiella sp.]